MIELKIDKEFKNVLPPLTEEEFNQLEENILKEGIINPIITWNNTIVDGHNRYSIAKKHPEINFTVKEKEFSNKYEVIDWIITHQKGQRNLTEAQRTVLIGRLLEVRKLANGGDRKSEDFSAQKLRTENGTPRKHSGRTTEQIGKEFGIAARTVDDAYAYHKGIEAIKTEDEEAANDILTGKLFAPKKEVIAIRKAEPEKVKEYVQSIKNEEKPKKKSSSLSKEDKEMIKEIKKDIVESRTVTAPYVPTINDVIENVKINSVPFINLFDGIINRHLQLIKDNKEAFIKVFDEFLVNKINTLRSKITNE